MSRITKELDAARGAVDELIRVTLVCGADWDRPRRPGKWSPSQIVEHVAKALEEGAKDVSGQESDLPSPPAPVRFALRHLLFNRVLRTGRFPKAKANPAMDPQAGPRTPDQGRKRLEVAWEVFERAIKDAASRGERATTGFFGTVALVELVRFWGLHTRHHMKQMPSR